MTLKQLYAAIRKSNYCEFLVCLEIKYPKYNETRHLIEYIYYCIEDDVIEWEYDWNEGEDILVTGVVPVELLDIDVLRRYIDVLGRYIV